MVPVGADEVRTDREGGAGEAGQSEDDNRLGKQRLSRFAARCFAKYRLATKQWGKTCAASEAGRGPIPADGDRDGGGVERLGSQRTRRRVAAKQKMKCGAGSVRSDWNRQIIALLEKLDNVPSAQVRGFWGAC